MNSPLPPPTAALDWLRCNQCGAMLLGRYNAWFHAKKFSHFQFHVAGVDTAAGVDVAEYSPMSAPEFRDINWEG